MKIGTMLFTAADVKRTSADAAPPEHEVNSPITEFYHSVQLHIHGNPPSLGGGIRFEREPKVHVDNKAEAKKQMKQVGIKDVSIEAGFIRDNIVMKKGKFHCKKCGEPLAHPRAAAAHIAKCCQ